MYNIFVKETLYLSVYILFSGNLQQTTQFSSEEKPLARKSKWMHTSLYIVMSVLAVVFLSYITTTIADKCSKKDWITDNAI